MDRQYEPIRQLLGVVRARHRALTACRAIVRAALAASAVVGVALALTSLVSFLGGSPWIVAFVGGVALLATLAAAAWGLMPLRHVPSDVRIARFIEERVPALDDRLATAVDVGRSGVLQTSSVLAAPLVADVARRAADVDVNEV